MTDPLDNAAAIVGVGAIMPDAPDRAAFWHNVTSGRYSISEVDPERWDPALYYDPDPKAPEKTYSKIGGWVREWDWDPFAWKLPIPPKVSEGMDDAHKWAVGCTRMALSDAGWPDRPLDLDRTAVIIGNALSGEKHYLTALRIMFPDLARELERTAGFAALPAEVRATIEGELHANINAWLPVITEDTMPGELGNCIAGRIANLFNLHGPNFTTDAACASALAAMDATVDGLLAHEFDVAITGGIDRNMGAHTFVKFCAIGALSPTGTRPYSEGADGFVMGEGAALFIVKRLADAVRDEDRIYAVVRGVGSASDGKGKGITAPNPVGQRFAVERAWRNAGLSPAECTLIEGHGTSTSVGDAVELSSLMEAFSGAHAPPGSIALGSVKSNIGHLKGAAGAAGMLKTTLALHDKVLPPSLNFERPNSNLDWSASPFAVNTELRDWDVAADRARVAGVSAFGFGGTNFHLVMEEYVPGRYTTNGDRSSVAVPAPVEPMRVSEPRGPAPAKPPLRGALVLGAEDEAGLANALRTELAEARQGRHLDPTAPSSDVLRAPERIAIDYADGPDLVAKAELASRALDAGNPAAWPALRARGIHRGSGSPGKVAFLYTGQGSQYANMIAELHRREPVVAELFEEADAIMAPLLEGRRLSDIVFADPQDPAAMARAEEELRRTEIQQPAVITVDTALTRLLGEYGIAPDLVMGHSVGEYAALVRAGALSFDDALEAVSARGREMASLRIEDPGAMAAVMAPLAEVEEIVAETEGYVVLANINSTHQVVLGGATEAVARAVAAVQERGHTAIPLPVSHGFHTEIVAPASGPLREMLQRLGLRSPQLPIVANVNGELYPSGEGAVEQMLDMLSRQVASPVQFLKGLRTLYDEGARIFVEVGPKHALQGFASDVLGDDAIVSLASNHPKQGDVPTFNNALCGLWAAGLGSGRDPVPREAVELQAGATAQPHPRAAREARARRAPAEPAPRTDAEPVPAPVGGDAPMPEPVAITGAALGLPGAERLFDDANIARLLNGEQGIDVIPGRLRRDMLDKHITRLVKGDDGGASFETIDRLEAVIKLAARAGAFDPVAEFGVDTERLAALGHDTQLAIAAGIDALRDAGIPLVLRYKTTTKGTKLPDRWSLPDEMRDDTGVIYASAFPGLEEMADEVSRYTTDHMRRERLAALESLRARMLDHEGTDRVVLDEVERRIHDLEHTLEEEPYTFDRRFLFRVLSMGHSQLAELIGARGPNTQINSACASTTQAVALAEDWIRAGRCRRVLIVAADDATSDTLMGWIGAGFLASGAAATDDVVEEAALPFDQRRHGMIIGMGAAGLMVESAAAARERAHDADLRGARVGDRQLRLPRDTARRRAHQRCDGAAREAGREPWPAAAGDRGGDGVRLPRDLHTRTRRQRRRRDPRAARRLRRARRPDRDRQREGVHRAPNGSRPRGRVGGEGAGDGGRPAGPELPRSRSRAGSAQPVGRRLVPDPLLAQVGGRVRLADLDAAAALDARRRSPQAQRRRARLRLPDRRSRRLGRMAETAQRLRGSAARGRAAPAARRRSGSARRQAAGAAGGCRRGAGGDRAGGAGDGARRARARAHTGPRRRRRRAARPRDRRRGDRLSARPARHGARPRGRPRDRHRQAGRGVRQDPRGLRDRARRLAEAARLPDPHPRRRLRQRALRRPGRRRPQPAPRPRPRPRPHRPPPATASSSASSRSSPRRPAIRPTCSTWSSTSRPTSGSTPSSRPRCSPRSARPTRSSATTR